MPTDTNEVFHHVTRLPGYKQIRTCVSADVSVLAIPTSLLPSPTIIGISATISFFNQIWVIRKDVWKKFYF